ncbi:hypothetical protein [Hymenobacter jeollabukensis]|uniref:Uncharacterized protein n=1 Tax=Hymenobacter jeollabukensis TaxID=2025313 RepID=A0A5R8WRS1_9BACT|nr:hypothetical protein [Hymenobacter jeollabukensis]TLM93894.1 hypothetical protein FDY95_07610 [Hymenobacter jeollabukensis]
MKTLCFSLLLAVLASAPFEAAFAGAPVAETTSLTTADHDAFGGGYKFKRKKRKKNRGNLRRKRHGLFGLGR